MVKHLEKTSTHSSASRDETQRYQELGDAHGGPKVLEATAQALGITAKDLAASWECLRKVGNISSTSVLLVLEDVYTQRPSAGSYSILAATGPGFCSELVLEMVRERGPE